MDKVLDEVENLINKLNETDFVINMKKYKKIIDTNHLINTSDVKELYKNDTIHEYILNQNILDYHIFYMNSEIKKLINRKYTL